MGRDRGLDGDDLKWAFYIVAVVVLLQLLYSAVGGHAPIWVLLPLPRGGR